MQSVLSRLFFKLNLYYRLCQHQQYVNPHVFISCVCLCLCILCTAVFCKAHFCFVLCVYCVHCVCVCTTWWSAFTHFFWCLLSFVLHVFVCLVFLRVFSMTFKSPSIELATVKVVIPFLNFASVHYFIYLSFFLLTKLTKKKTKRRYHKKKLQLNQKQTGG